jgi:hypothetical protein
MIDTTSSIKAAKSGTSDAIADAKAKFALRNHAN